MFLKRTMNRCFVYINALKSRCHTAELAEFSEWHSNDGAIIEATFWTVSEHNIRSAEGRKKRTVKYTKRWRPNWKNGALDDAVAKATQWAMLNEQQLLPFIYRLSTTINIIYAFMILWWWWQFRNCDNWQSAQFNFIQCATRYNLLFARDFCYFNTFVSLLFYMTFFIPRIDGEKRGWKYACSTIFFIVAQNPHLIPMKYSKSH